MAIATAARKFITAYGPKYKVRLDFIEPTRTHQSGKDECDINKIMAKYVKTGVLDHQKEYGENYGFASSIDLLEAMTIVTTANEMFDELPAEVRKKFNHNAGDFLDFVQNPENEAELIKMGLATKKEEEPEIEEKTVETPEKQAAETPPAE